MGESSFQSAIAAVLRPLEFAAQDDFSRLDRVRDLAASGFKVLATPGTADFLNGMEVAAESVPKVGQGHPDVVERIESGDVDLVINTVDSQAISIRDSASIRRSALLRGIPYCTTVAGARASVGAILAMQAESIGVRALQEIHPTR